MGGHGQVGEGGGGGLLLLLLQLDEPIRRKRYIGYLKKPMSSTLFIGHVSEILAGG